MRALLAMVCTAGRSLGRLLPAKAGSGAPAGVGAAGAARAARRFSAQGARRQQQRLAAARDEFAEWLAANPLPQGRASSLPASAAAPAPARDAPPLGAAPVSLQQLLPRLQALAGAYPGAAWRPDSHAWIMAGARAAPLAELRLPRIAPPPVVLPGAAAPSLEAYLLQLQSGHPSSTGISSSGGSGASGSGAGWGGEMGAQLAGSQQGAGLPGGLPYMVYLDDSSGGFSSSGAVGSSSESGASASSGGALRNSAGHEAGKGWGGAGEWLDGDDSSSSLSAEDAAALAELQLPQQQLGGGTAGGSGGSGGLRLGSVLFVMLAADAAALGLWRDGALVRHKVLTGYTVRRSCGGAQDAFERRGGGRPTVGSALRRRETTRLWQAAAARLDAWGPDVAGCHTLLQAGAVRNWSLLYGAAKPPPPVDKRDPRWARLGLSVPRPRFRSLLAAYAHAAQGELRVYDPAARQLLL